MRLLSDILSSFLLGDPALCGRAVRGDTKPDIDARRLNGTEALTGATSTSGSEGLAFVSTSSLVCMATRVEWGCASTTDEGVQQDAPYDHTSLPSRQFSADRWKFGIYGIRRDPGRPAGNGLSEY